MAKGTIEPRIAMSADDQVEPPPRILSSLITLANKRVKALPQPNVSFGSSDEAVADGSRRSS
jgi:hypothetical protein